MHATDAYGLPLLVLGAMVRERLVLEPGPSGGSAPNIPLRLGTTAGVTGLVAMLVALGLGWPRPAALVTIGLMNAAVLIGLACFIQLPFINVPGSICLVIGVVTIYPWVSGELTVDDSGTQLLALAVSPFGSIGFTLLAGVFVFCGKVLARLGRCIDAVFQYADAGVAALIATVTVLPDGLTGNRGVVVRLAQLGKPVTRRVGVAAVAEGRLTRWFLPAQATLGMTVVALSLWVCSTYDTTSARFSGPFALALFGGRGGCDRRSISSTRAYGVHTSSRSRGRDRSKLGTDFADRPGPLAPSLGPLPHRCRRLCLSVCVARYREPMGGDRPQT